MSRAAIFAALDRITVFGRTFTVSDTGTALAAGNRDRNSVRKLTSVRMPGPISKPKLVGAIEFEVEITQDLIEMTQLDAFVGSEPTNRMDATDSEGIVAKS